jgi:hypothetical protein
MSDESATPASAPAAQTKPRTSQRLLQIAATFIWWIGALFVSAGRLDWVRGWISVGTVGSWDDAGSLSVSGGKRGDSLTRPRVTLLIDSASSIHTVEPAELSAHSAAD